MIGRFDKTHGTGVDIPLPSKKKPPLVITVKSKQQLAEKPNNVKGGRSTKNATENLWQEMMQRTMEQGDDVKRGDYALSQ